MTTQPDALRLADGLGEHFPDPSRTRVEEAAAAELRRQHERIAELEAQHSDIAVIAYLDAKKESAKRIEELEAALDVALEALETVTKHFTKVPSSLKDSETRGVAHAAMQKLKEVRGE